MSEINEREKELLAQIEAIKAEKDAEATAKAGLVEELKAEREAKRLAKEEVEKIKSTANADDPEEIVKRILNKKDEESVQEAFDSVKEEMRRSHNEFDPTTDSAGIVFKKFEDELAKFNFDGLKTKEQIKARMQEVYEFQNRGKRTETKPNFYGGTKNISTDAPALDGNSLTGGEKKLMEDLEWTKERFLQVKEKRPAFVKSLLSNSLKYRD